MDLVIKLFFFLIGAFLLCMFSSIQKLVIGAPLVINGYFVPAGFGGTSGLIVGNYIMKLVRLKTKLLNSNVELELRVEERTVKLVKSNKQLQREIDGRKKAEKEREKFIKELQEALEDVKTLSGLLPICASCKKIRDDKGYWNSLEGYIQTHSEAKFSHGMCPECSDKFYGKEDWYIEMKKEK